MMMTIQIKGIMFRGIKGKLSDEEGIQVEKK